MDWPRVLAQRVYCLEIWRFVSRNLRFEQYCEYYHHERIHQSLDRIIEPKHSIDEKAEIVCIERLGGLLNINF